MVKLVSKDKCTGCSACFNACKVGAISMETNETGFWFPEIKNSKCIECGACMRSCPVLEKLEYKSIEPHAFIVQNKDDEIRKQSTSGGAFTAIAKYVIKKGGVVFGAAIDENYDVSHIWINNEFDIAKFRSSKYVQSWIGKAYQEAESFLKNGGGLCCFSGTPCQIYGLKKYLGRDYENLITVCVMCRAVPSPKVLHKYLEVQREKYPSFDRITFRDKGRGYSYSGVALYQGEKILYRGGSESDPWLRLFLGGFCNRDACHECIFQDGERASDITMWDCWETQVYAPEWDDNKGTTNIIVWTNKGNKIIEDSNELRVKEIGIKNIDANLKRLPLKKPEFDQTAFFIDCSTLTAKKFIDKYVPNTAIVRMKKLVRCFMHTLHLHDTVRKAVHRIRKAMKH